MNSPWLTAYRHFSCHAHVLTFFLFYFPERGKLADPFYRLEHGEKDMQKKKEAEPVLVRLQRVSDSRHSDDYALNKALRTQLRASHCGYMIIYYYYQSLNTIIPYVVLDQGF